MIQEQYQNLLHIILLVYVFVYQFTNFNCEHLCWRDITQL